MPAIHNSSLDVAVGSVPHGFREIASPSDLRSRGAFVWEKSPELLHGTAICQVFRNNSVHAPNRSTVSETARGQAAHISDEDSV